MHAWINYHFLDGDVGLSESGVSRSLVAGLPVEDVVVMMAWAVRAFLLVLDVLADHRGILRHSLERIDIARKCFVFDLDQFSGVGRGVPVFGNDESYFLVLEHHLAIGEHHLHVAGKRRHPGQIDCLQRLSGDHRDDAGQCRGLGGVDLLHARMGVRRAGKVAIEHAGQFDVIDVIALSLRETDVLDALPFAAHTFELGGAFGGGGSDVAHSAASWYGTPLSLAAANWMALTMFW